MSEADFMRRVQQLASQLGARLFRQQTGMGWIGEARKIFSPQTVRLYTGDVVIKHARPFHTGFKGWSDLGGWTPVTITPEMVGTTIAVYVQAEIKVDAATTQEQRDWIDAVNKAGGRAAVVKSENDLQKLLLGTQ